MKRKIKKGRSAKTGQFVSDEFVKENPETTVTDTIELPVKHEEKVKIEDQYTRL